MSKKEKNTISENHSQIKGYVINLFNKKRAAMGMPLVPFEEPEDMKLKREAKEAIHGARKMIDTLEELIDGKITIEKAEKIVESLDIKIGDKKANAIEKLFEKVEMAVNKPKQIEEVQVTSSSAGAEQEAKPVENTKEPKQEEIIVEQEKKPEPKKAAPEISKQTSKTGLNPIVPTEKKEQQTPKLPEQQRLTNKEKKELRKQQRQEIKTPEKKEKEEVAGVAKEVSVGDMLPAPTPASETGSYVGAGNNPYLQNIMTYVKTYDIDSKQCMDSLGQAMAFNNRPIIFEDNMVKFWMPTVLQTPDLQRAAVQ